MNKSLILRMIVCVLFIAGCTSNSKDKTFKKGKLLKTRYYQEFPGPSFHENLYEFNFNIDYIYGHRVTVSKYHETIDTAKVHGWIKNNKLKWYLNNLHIEKGRMDSAGDIEIASEYDNSKSFLKQIDAEIFHNKINEVLFPKLITLKGDTVIGNYLFEIEVNDWNEYTNYGNTTVVIKDKSTKEVIQTITSDRFWFSPFLYFGYDTDYNFDNINDLYFYNGNNGGYGTPTYCYYIYDKKLNKFIYNQQLEYLAACMGMKVDKAKKRIISYAKSGCCWHKQEAYVAKGDTFILMKRLVNDEFNYPKSIILERFFPNGKTNKKTYYIDKITKKQIDRLYENF